MTTAIKKICFKGGALDGKTLIVKGGGLHQTGAGQYGPYGSSSGSLATFTIDLTDENVGIDEGELKKLIDDTNKNPNNKLSIAGAVAEAVVVSDIQDDAEVSYLEPGSIHGFGVSDSAIDKKHLLLGGVSHTRDTDAYIISIEYPAQTQLAHASGDTSGCTDPQRPDSVVAKLDHSGSSDEKFKTLLEAVNEAGKLQT